MPPKPIELFFFCTLILHSNVTLVRLFAFLVLQKTAHKNSLQTWMATQPNLPQNSVHLPIVKLAKKSILKTYWLMEDQMIVTAWIV